jgi:predicted 2-oxoglutarate/Fe(II)-dependent dioxygenase YbiX
MQDQSQSPADNVILRDQRFTAGRKNYFLVGPVCFDDGQIVSLKTIVDKLSEPAQVGQVGQDYATGSSVDEGRRTRVRSLHPAEHRWVYDIVANSFNAANQLMRCDVVPSLSDPIQLLRYDAEEAGHFRWHADTLPSDMTRKISIVVPLSSPTEYEGGELQFNQGGGLCAVEQVPGRPIAFPSWLVHQITPVTRGQRYSLVAWIRGPNWR